MVSDLASHLKVGRLVAYSILAGVRGLCRAGEDAKGVARSGFPRARHRGSATVLQRCFGLLAFLLTSSDALPCVGRGVRDVVAFVPGLHDARRSRSGWRAAGGSRVPRAVESLSISKGLTPAQSLFRKRERRIAAMRLFHSGGATYSHPSAMPDATHHHRPKRNRNASSPQSTGIR